MPLSLKLLAVALVLVAGVAAVTAALAILSIRRYIVCADGAADFASLVAGCAARSEIPGALVYIRKGDEVVVAEAAGTTRKEGGPAVTPETPFRTASVGKLFTAAVVLRLAERGRIDLDAPAATYLDEDLLRGLVVVDGVDYWGQFTVRQLLGHRSGVGDIDADLVTYVKLVAQPTRKFDGRSLALLARHVEPSGRPGEHVRYSSSGYNLLGLVIEAVEGEPLHVVVRRELLDRLAMASTFSAAHEWTGEPEMLHPYLGWFDIALYDPSVEYADGGYVTTAADLATFGLAAARGELFDQPETRALFFGEDAAPDGAREYQSLGPMMMRTEGGARTATHTGAWCVFFALYPDDDAVAVFTLGQANADIWSFWAATRRLAVAEGYLPD